MDAKEVNDMQERNAGMPDEQECVAVPVDYYEELIRAETTLGILRSAHRNGPKYLMDDLMDIVFGKNVEKAGEQPAGGESNAE